MEHKNLSEYYRFLDDLRLLGTINVFGSSHSLQNSFKLDKSTSNLVVSSWMHTFNEELSAGERAAEALERGLVS